MQNPVLNVTISLTTQVLTSAMLVLLAIGYSK